MDHLKLDSFVYEEENSKTKTKEELEAEQAAAADTAEKEKEEKEEEEKEDKTKSEDKVPTQEELEAEKIKTLETLKAKKPTELSEEEKTFLVNFGEEETDEDSYDTVLKSLNEDAIIELAEGKEYKGIDGFKEAIVDNIKLGIDSYKQKFPEKVKDLLKYIEDGGSFEDYQSILDEVDYSTVDIKNETNKRLIVQDYYLSLGYEDDDIEERINILVEKDKLDKEAELAKTKLSTTQKTNRERKIQEQTQKAEENKQKIQKDKEKFKESIMSLEDFQGFKVTAKDKQDIYDYLTIPVKEGKSQFQIDSADPKVLSMLAFLAKKKFKFDNLEKSVKSKSAKDLREALDKLSKGDVSKNKGQQRQQTQHEETSQVIGLPWLK